MADDFGEKSGKEQVEFYFSDGNLGKPDRWFREKMKRGNHPVTLADICNAPMMKKFDICDVEDALRSSDLVDVVEHDGVTSIQRKVPIVWPPSVKKAKITGFEDNYAELPIELEAVTEERQLYAKDLPFAERIETAVQRYMARRKFSSQRRNIFTKFLSYGGIDSGPKQFGGIDQADMKDMTADEIRSLTATVFVGNDKFDEGENAPWIVDFESIAKGFLSTMVPFFWDFESQKETQECISTLRNFYKYLQAHEVCAEYEQDISSALQVCDAADVELYAAHTLMKSFPGDFNTACYILFESKGLDVDNANIGSSSSDQWKASASIMTVERARQVFAMGCAAHALSTDKDRDLFEQTIAKTESNVGIELTDIIPASKNVHDFYNVKDKSNTKFKPLGKIICKAWTIPDFVVYDLPKGFKSPSRPHFHELYLEQDILDKCFKGMKMEVTMHTLSGGLTYLSQVVSVNCSFYTVLENELLRGWKEPVWATREQQEEAGAKEEGGEGFSDDE